MTLDQTPSFTPEEHQYKLIEAVETLKAINDLSDEDLALLVTVNGFAFEHGKLCALLQLLNQRIFLLPPKAADDLDRPSASSAAVVGQGGNQ
jgi:hypothetical protein